MNGVNQHRNIKYGLIILFLLSSLHNGWIGYLSIKTKNLRPFVFAVLKILIKAFGIFSVLKGKRFHFVGLRILVILELARDITWLVLVIVMQNGFKTYHIPDIVLGFVVPIVLQTSIIFLIQMALNRLARMNQVRPEVQQVPSIITVR